MEPNVDVILQNGTTQGDIAAFLASQGKLDPGQLRPFVGKDGKAYVDVYTGGDPKDIANYRAVPINVNATLRRDEWKTLDEAILKISETRLGGVDDLVSNGLTYTLGNAMGTTVLEWHDVSDALEADLTMDGVTRGIADRPKFQHNYLPIPIVHADYEINARVLAASRNMGNSLDTTLAERAARKVKEKVEQMLFTNTTYSYGETDDRSRNTIYSYINHPDRNQVTLTVGWDDSSTTPAKILSDVVDMKQASINAKHYGPWMLYIPATYETSLDDDYYTAGPTRHAGANTVRERIKAVAGIKDVKVVDTLPNDNVLLVQMTSDVVRLVQGMGLTNVEWQTEGKFIHKYKVLAIQVPQIRSDQEGNSGIIHLA